MFLIGVSLGEGGPHTAIVIVKRVRKNLRKYYHVLDGRCLPAPSGYAAVTGEIEAAYGRRDLTVDKPRFNQNGRPVRRVRIRPLVLVEHAGCGAELIQHLRNRRIPVEAFRFAEILSWQKQDFGRGLGHDLTVSTENFVETLRQVYDQHRLVFPPDQPAGLRHELEKFLRSAKIRPSGDKSGNLAAALSLPVWYYENLLALRPKSP